MSEILTLLLILALGSALGTVRIRNFSLDTLGILIVGMLFGHFGASVSPVLMNFGVSLLVYAIALQIGPGFVESFRSDGLKYMAAALLPSVVAVVVSLISGYALGLGLDSVMGAYTGAFNSAISFAALLGQMDAHVFTQAFGTVYPITFGLAILFINYTPLFLRADVKREIREHREEFKRRHPPPLKRHFRVTNPGCDGKTLDQLDLPALAGASITRVAKGEQVVAPRPDLVFHLDDLVEAVGTREDLERLALVLGEVTQEPFPVEEGHSRLVDRRFLVTNKEVVGKTLAELKLREKCEATVTRIRRGGVDIPVTSRTQLAYGDRVTVVVREDKIPIVTSILGDDLHAFGRQDLMPVFIGMALGALVGLIPWPIPGLGQFRLGLVGGVLIVGITFGRLGKVGPVVFTITAQANHVLKRLAIMLFMAALGTTAGSDLWANLLQVGIPTVLVSVATLLGALITAMIFARFVLGRDIVDTLAIMSGSIASTPALETVVANINAQDAYSTYAAIYPMGLMGPVLVAQIMIHLKGMF